MKQRVSVKEAARLLNVSEAAVRQRIQRNTIVYEKDEESNRVFVVLDDVGDRLDDDTDIGHSDNRELIDTLQEQLSLEREASAELRRIIAGLTQRIPAIEAPEESPDSHSAARESRVTTSEGEARGTTVREDDTEQERRSWWRRFFGY